MTMMSTTMMDTAMIEEGRDDDEEHVSFLILRSMLKQEQECYKIHNYFDNNNNNTAITTRSKDNNGNINPPVDVDARPLTGEWFMNVMDVCNFSKEYTTLNNGNINPPIDVDARQFLGEWFMDVMDLCNFSKEYATIAMSILDRFCCEETTTTSSSSNILLLDRKQYQLAALTALYITVKVHCPKVFSLESMANLSKGVHSQTDIKTMECHMLHTIQWKINPPTTMDFVRIYYDITISKLSQSRTCTSSTCVGRIIDIDELHSRHYDTIMELALYQSNISILKFDIATQNASHIAIAVFLNALEVVLLIWVDDNQTTMLYDTIFNDIIVKYFIIQDDLSAIKKLQKQLHQFISSDNRYNNSKNKHENVQSLSSKKINPIDSNDTNIMKLVDETESSASSPRSIIYEKNTNTNTNTNTSTSTNANANANANDEIDSNNDNGNGDDDDDNDMSMNNTGRQQRQCMMM